MAGPKVHAQLPSKYSASIDLHFVDIGGFQKDDFREDNDGMGRKAVGEDCVPLVFREVSGVWFGKMFVLS